MAKVLVIEDEVNLQKAIARILSINGYDVTCAKDGRSALDQIREEHPDIVLTDIFMPGMEGLETIRVLASRFPELPIVIMTGSLDTLFIDLGKKFGACEALNKPFSTDELLLVINKSLTGRTQKKNSDLLTASTDQNQTVAGL